MGDYRYYFTPKGMIALAELPPGWGLLEQRGRSIYEVMDASCFNEHNTCGERAILISLIRRIGQDSPKGVSVNFYTFQTKNTATAGVEEKETNNRIYDLTIEALQADGAHHKQWYLEEILKAVGRSDVFEKSSGVIWDKGVAP